jgi:O-antigen/teichoic acid export membrane protein
MLNVLATLAIPLAAGLALVAEDAVAVVLGGQWAMTVPWLRWLAVGAVLTMLVDVLSNNILFVTRNERYAVRIMWLYVVFLVPTCVVASKMGGIEAVAMATTVCGLIMLPVAAMTLSRAIGVSLRQIVAAVWRPVVAVLAMALVVRAAHSEGLAMPALRLVIDVAAGAAAYSAALVACWMAAGRPDGIERHAWSLLARRLRRSA